MYALWLEQWITYEKHSSVCCYCYTSYYQKYPHATNQTKTEPSSTHPVGKQYRQLTVGDTVQHSISAANFKENNHILE